MSEKVKEVDTAKVKLQLALKRIGIELPLHAEKLSYPRKWLVRGETNKQRLLQGLDFDPQSGQMGTRGVFLGDCFDPLMVPEKGVYYVFERDQVASDWLVFPSDAYDQWASELARNEHLNPNSISDGVLLENLMYSRYPIYQSATGICTLPYTVHMDQVTTVLVTPDFLDEDEYSQLPKTMREKIVWLK